MSNNLIARLRNVQFWQADCDVRMQAAARIEELETKLAKAVEALAGVDRFAKDLEYCAEPSHHLATPLARACEIYAEIKGETE